MPKSAERRFKAGARKRHMRPGTKRYNAYVYGGMRERGLLESQRRLDTLKRSSAAANRRPLAKKRRPLA